MKKTFVWCLVVGALYAVNVNAQPDNLSIKFRHKVGNRILQLFDSTYTNSFAEPFIVNRFRYYVSDITLVGSTNSNKIFRQHSYLIDEADSSSKNIPFYFPKGAIRGIEFTIGIDSANNTRGVQTGDLDPIKGMFWTWNSGYVYAKLEGTSDSSHAPANTFGFHVGGYRTHENAARKVKLDISSSLSAIKEIVIDVDILKWFNATHRLCIAQQPICHQPGELAMKFADNYATMFSIAEIH